MPEHGDEIEQSPTLDEVAALLRLVKFTLDRTESAFVAFVDSRYLDYVKRDLDRLREMKSQVRAMLKRLPPEPPMSIERQEAIGNVIAAALDKRFGNGSAEDVRAAVRAAWEAEQSGRSETP